MGSSVRVHELVVAVSSVLGLVLGSFLNVVVYRVPRGLSVVSPPSHCPNCGTALSQLDNVPLLSWAVLRGRCRTCRVPISARYPLVEAATGTGFGLAAAFVTPVAPLIPVLVVVVAAWAAAGIDYDQLRLPPVLVWLAAAGDAGLIGVAAADHHGWQTLTEGVGVAACLVAALLADWLIGRFGGVPADTGTGLDPRRAVLVGLLGGVVGWFWWPAGPILAGWVLATSVPMVLGRGHRRPPVATPATEGRAPALRRSPAAPLALLALGFFAVLLVGASLG